MPYDGHIYINTRTVLISCAWIMHLVIRVHLMVLILDPSHRFRKLKDVSIFGLDKVFKAGEL